MKNLIGGYLIMTDTVYMYVCTSERIYTSCNPLLFYNHTPLYTSDPKNVI